ncbi:MAG TPA: FlgD immunoglobulin-like domain containing protein [Candidatus Eisenbacteria bacterium]|nr:FlgD immunoglobulin-like domain containing protein [Candidatus Eisenbacteria bacterium]
MSGDPDSPHISRAIRAALAALLIVAATIQARPAATSEAYESVMGLPPEVEDDPPDLTTSLTQPTSMAASVTYGRFTSVQVNVNPLGANIIHDAANEPSIAVDPNNISRIAIGWRQFDSINSNFRQAGYGYSTNGGLTWTTGKIQPGTFRSDPVLSFDAQGRFIYNSLANNLACSVFHSTNGGATWGPQIPAYGGDKQWMAVDRTGGMGHDHVYEAWSTASNPSPGLTFSRSNDDGATWEFPSAIPNSPIWGTLDVGPDGTLYVAGMSDLGSPCYVARSTNAKNAAVAPTFVSVPIDLGGTIQTGGPNPVGLLGQLWIAVDHSAGPRHGWVYVLASVMTPTDPLDVMFIRSTDGGQTWSTPVRVNDDPAGNNALQWFGTMSVSPNGRIDAVWNDTRGQATSNLCALYFSSSYDGGATWSPNEQASPVWNSSLGYPRQDKIGDYYHMISRDDGADLAWAATFNGEQDVYFMRVAATVTAAEDPVSPARLLGATPNPFTSSTSIQFELPRAGRARIDVYDAGGRRVTTLLDGEVGHGAHRVRWEGVDDSGRRVRPGLYLCRLEAASESRTAKLMLLR